MMRKLLIAFFTLFLSVSAQAASTSYQATLGSGAGFAAWCIGGSGPACTGGVFWPSTVIANSSGTELFTSGNPGFVGLASAAVQPGAYQPGAISDMSGTTVTTAHGCAVAGYGVAPCIGQVDDDVKALTTAAVQPVPYLPATTPTTNTYSNGSASPTNGDLHGAVYVHQTPQTDTVAGLAPVKGGVGVVNGGSGYNTIAASTALKLSSTQGGGTGALGDYVSSCLIIPSSTSPGAVTLTDGSGSAITIFAGGVSSLSNLAPFPIPLGLVSISGGWTLTTLANATAVCGGRFT